MVKLKKLSVVTDDEKYSETQLLNVLYKHLIYSFKDINSYDELTEEEKKIIPKEMFEYLTEKEEDSNGYMLTYTTDSTYNGVSTTTKHFKSLRKAIGKAKEVQNEFCEEYEIADKFPHNYGEVVNGRTYCSTFNEINGCGKFLTEDERSNRLWIEIEKIRFEEQFKIVLSCQTMGSFLDGAAHFFYASPQTTDVGPR